MRACTVTLAAALVAYIALAPFANAGIPVGQGAEAEQIPSLAPLLRKITPAVVSITVGQQDAQQDNPLLQDPFLRELFGAPGLPLPPKSFGAGSGVIFDAVRGLIITDSHVVQNATDMTVILLDKRRLRASVVGVDEDTDIAVVKVSAENLTAIPLGNSDRLEVGDFVLAIGNPFTLGQTVTSGIVSALHRSGLGLGVYEDFIQSDASINPGSSGGPLVDLHGELVGINTAIVGVSGGNVGIGFAVPINMVRNIADQLVTYGSASHGQLGITVQELNPDLVSDTHQAIIAGAVVARIEAGSAAQRVGLRIGDIVIAINSSSVRDAADLRVKIGMSRVGELAELTVLREGRPLAIRATLAAPVKKILNGEEVSRNLEGAVFSTTSSGLPGKGITVDAVRAGSNASRVGLKKGDVITWVNETKVSDLDAFSAQITAGGRRLILSLVRGSHLMVLEISDKSQ